VKLALEELTHMEDDPQALLSVAMQRAAMGPVYGRHPGGEAESLPRITRQQVRDQWQGLYHAGRIQIVIAGPVDADALADRIDGCFAGRGRRERSGREPAAFTFTPTRVYREKDLKQQYIGISLAAAAKDSPDFPIEQVLLGVLSGGMSARLFTEV